jgi:type VI secretion system protein VasD
VAGIGTEAIKRHSAPQAANTPQPTNPGAAQPVKPNAIAPIKPVSKAAPIKDDWARPA